MIFTQLILLHIYSRFFFPAKAWVRAKRGKKGKKHLAISSSTDQFLLWHGFFSGFSPLVDGCSRSATHYFIDLAKLYTRKKTQSAGVLLWIRPACP
jgi:hypothetical protein